MNKFNWLVDVGGMVSPIGAVRDARRMGQSFTQYAEEYAADWPFEDGPPEYLVEGMVREMERAAAEETPED